MTCKTCKTKTVWEFTNQTKLCKTCFLDYVEKKVFRTIRQYNMLPKDKQFILEKSDSLNTAVLKSILENKFQVKFGKPNFTAENLSEIAEEIFNNILQGKFISKKPTNQPLYLVSDAELELYAKLKNIKGKVRKKDRKVRELFEKFMGKNPDLEINIVKAVEQLEE